MVGSVDPFVGLLDGPRARSAFLLRCLLDPPWSIVVQDEAPVGVVVVMRGDAWFLPGTGAGATVLTAGDVLVARGAAPYVLADDPGTAPDIVIAPNGECRTPAGEALHETMRLGVRAWGNSTTGETMLLVGTYGTDGEISRVLLDALPQALVIRAADVDSAVRDLLSEELVKDRPGQQLVLDRLLDLLLVGALRAAFTSGGATPRWYRASADPTIGQAIRLIHERPAEPWTVAGLAAVAGVSRSHFARRFHELVGEAPMAFLTAWRMALAADLLLDSDATVADVAREVGYANPFTFSTAFKRHFGAAPRAYRSARPA